MEFSRPKQTWQPTGHTTLTADCDSSCGVASQFACNAASVIACSTDVSVASSIQLIKWFVFYRFR